MALTTGASYDVRTYTNITSFVVELFFFSFYKPDLQGQEERRVRGKSLWTLTLDIVQGTN